jgi:crossover junction endodeoxyribonuclease RuvC
VGAQPRATIENSGEKTREALGAGQERLGTTGAPLRILGVDPGSNATGFGVIECAGARLAHVVHGTLRPGRSGGLAARLHDLHRAIGDVIAQHRPDVASVEQVFVAASPRAALVLGQARGAVLAALGETGLVIREYAPAEIKRAVTGNGRAAKPQVQRMVRSLLSLSDTPPADASDALAAAICCAHMGRLASLGVIARGRRHTRRAPGISVRRVP